MKKGYFKRKLLFCPQFTFKQKKLTIADLQLNDHRCFFHKVRAISFIMVSRSIY